MGLENIRTVDVFGIEMKTGYAVLSVIDAWDWSSEMDHLWALQEKINSYFEFVQTGQIYEERPEAKGRPIRIDVISKFPIPDIGLALLQGAGEVAAQLDIEITHRVHRDG